MLITREEPAIVNTDRKHKQLFQEDPLEWRPHAFKLRGWTDTVTGYLNEADQLSRCILRNRKLIGRDYPLKATIFIRQEQSITDVLNYWTKACRNLRRHGVVALWVREPTRRNRVHYHLVVRSPAKQREMEKAIEASLPARSVVPYHKQVRPILSQYYWPRYITKAKVPFIVDGRATGDRYNKKRLLFKPKLGLRKVGTIGRFWEKSRRELWEEIKEIEIRIAEGLERQHVKALAEHVYDLLGETIPLKTIERSFGFSSGHPSVQSWIDAMLLEEKSSLG